MDNYLLEATPPASGPKRQPLPDLGTDSRRRMLTRGETATFLGISVPTLERWHRIGFGPALVKIGPRKIGYPVDELMAFVEQRRIQPRVDTGVAGQRAA